MQIMLMNISEVDGEIEYLIVQKETKFTGSGKLGLKSSLKLNDLCLSFMTCSSTMWEIYVD